VSVAAKSGDKPVSSSGGRKHRVTLIPGDGIGPEVVGAAVRAVEATGVPIEWDRQRAGREALLEEGTPIPDSLLRSIRKNRVALKGPIATHVGHGFRSVNVGLRKAFDLFANLRPIRSIPGVKSLYSSIDLIVVRENTEDLYAGIEHQISPGVVESVKVITARASTRIAEFAFRYATQHGRKKVTAIHKANIMKLSDGLFLACARKVAKRYPDVAYDEMIVDNACMQLVLKPHQFDVLLLENLYGDIVSDLCAGLVGGLGVTPAANLGARCAIFEAVHGTAPDIAARRVVVAVDEAARHRWGRTPDLGGSATTEGVADALVAAISGREMPRVPVRKAQPRASRAPAQRIA
jgi:isocitrate dehydrogenase (NAD+)